MADLVINLMMAGEQVVIGGLRRVGEVALNAFGAVLGQVADFAADSFKGAIEAQKGIDALGASITRLGAKAPVTMAGAEGLAEQFKNLVGGSDDTVLAMTNVGLRFDKISKDTFPRFIEQSADLATVLKTDPVKASEILGKALQDLSVDGVGSVGRLKAAGVSFTDDQEKLIKSLVEQGKVTEAQTVLMDALAATTGGAAAAAAGTAAGQWAIFQETIADAGEGVALALLPVLTKLASDILPRLTPIIENVADVLTGLIDIFVFGKEPLGDWSSLWEKLAALFGEGVATVITDQVIPAIQDFAAKAQEFITGVIIPAFQQAVAWIQANWPAIQATIADVWAQAQPILQAIGDYILNVVIPALQTAVQWVITNWPMIQATITQVMTEVQTVIQTVLTAVQAFWSEWGDEIIAVINFFADQYKTIFSAFSAAFEGDWRKFGEILRGAWNNVWKAIQEIAQRAMDWFSKQDWGAIGKGIIDGIANGISAAAGWLADAAKRAAQAALDAAKGFLGIHSPSTVFAGVGKNMMLGMAQGITANAGLPAYATANAAAMTTISVGAINVNGANMTNGGVGVAVRAELERMGRSADTRIRTR